MSNILEINKLNKKFKKQIIIKNMSFSMEKGDILSIMGKSGVGKSTLLRIIAGLELPDSGNISINEKIVNSSNIFIEPYQRGIGFVFQNANLWPHMSMKENILFALSESYSQKMEELLKIANIDNIMNKYPNEVSEGEAKRVSIVRAICSGAKILLMDEPFSNLDDEMKYEIIDLIKKIHIKNELSILMVSHNLDENTKLSHKIFELSEGRLNERIM